MNILVDTDYWKIANQDKRLKKKHGKNMQKQNSKFIFKTSGFIELSPLTPLRLIMTNNKDLRGNESILFVDDESFIVHVQQKVFERYGYSVAPFVSSLDALNEFKARPGIFDIVICDMAMPIMTGLELARRIKQIRPDIPAIISTGFSEQINNDNYRDMGVDGFLMKPFSKEDSLKLIRHLLDNR
ncbi:MAG: response regulator [Desulfobacula sp.]|nr:response regulator [Desulfobacula sp.]